MSKYAKSKTTGPHFLLLRCVGTPVVGPCNAVIEVPVEMLNRPKKQGHDGFGGVTRHLFKVRWMLSLITKQEKTVYAPLCLVCSKKTYPADFLRECYEHLEKQMKEDEAPGQNQA